MDPARASMTAIGTALMRALHTRVGDPPLLEDPWGDRLFRPDEGGDELDARLRAHPNYGTVIMRARYTEDALALAVARGIRQYVIVGAGMDSYALRSQGDASGVEVIEVDHPATQELKVSRLAERGIDQPERLHLIAADLGETTLGEALAGSPLRPDRGAFVAWLGVTSYLTREQNLTTLRAIAALLGEDGELVFSYLEQAALDADTGPLQEVRAALAEAGEPWRSGFHPSELASVLAGTGLALIEDLGPDELHERYCSGRSDGLTPSPAAHVARAGPLSLRESRG